MELGKRVRQLRKEQNRTLQEISDKCGFTRSLLSKIETGKTVPAVSTLMKIADALGVKVSVLIEENDQSGTILTRSDKMNDTNNLIKTDKGYSFFAFAVERREKLMQPYLFIAKKGEIKRHIFSHAGEEFIYVLEGDMNYKVGDIEYTLHPGDSVYFNSLDEHMLTPISDKVKYLAVFTESKSGPEKLPL